MENTVRPDRHPDRHADRHADHATQTGVVTRMLTHVFGALVRIVMLPPQLVRLAGRALRAGRRAVAPVGRRAGTGVRHVARVGRRVAVGLARVCRRAGTSVIRWAGRGCRSLAGGLGRVAFAVGVAYLKARADVALRSAPAPLPLMRRDMPPLPKAAFDVAVSQNRFLPAGRTPDRRHHRHHLDGRRTVSRRRSSGGHPPRLLGLDGPPLVEAAVRPSGDCRRSGCPSGWRVVRGRAR